MKRRDWNLLVLSAAGGEPLSPVQIQKSLFLLGQTLPQGVRGEDYYQFEPYDYGPFDSKVYSDASTLAKHELARVSRSSVGRWSEYAATQSGMEQAKLLARSLPDGVEDYVKRVVYWVRSQSFTSLVRSIYERYPEMRVNSVFRG